LNKRVQRLSWSREGFLFTSRARVGAGGATMVAADNTSRQEIMVAVGAAGGLPGDGWWWSS